MNKISYENINEINTGFGEYKGSIKFNGHPLQLTEKGSNQLNSLPSLS